jgi:hypothetical protein
MPVAFFQVPLSVQPKSGGTAEILVPEVLRDLNYGFVIVKEGAEEGIVRVDASETDLKKITGEANCTRLDLASMKALYESYPKPKLKQQYQTKAPTPQPLPATAAIPRPPQVAGEAMEPPPSQPPQAEVGGNIPGQQFETDDQGNPVLITLQTVRSGFYLIDVPIVEKT